MNTRYDVRYVLIARDVEQKRVAVVGTPRSLTDIACLHRSLFALYPQATVVEVVLPPAPGEKLADQEVLLSAERSSELPGAIVWTNVRSLKAIEADIDSKRK